MSIAPTLPATGAAPVRGPVPQLSTAAEALDAARAYADSIAAGVIDRDRAGQVPVTELAALDASGLLGITVPAAHGGPDLPPPVLAEVIRTIAAVDPAIAQVPQAHFLFVDVLATHGTAAQQDRLLRDVLAGARLGNGLAERAGGTPRTCAPGCTSRAAGCAWTAASTTAPARSRPAGSGSARWTTMISSCWRSSSGPRTASSSATTGT